MVPRKLPIGVRSPANLSLEAKGYDDIYSTDKVEAIGSIFVGAGATLKTDPLGKVNLKGQTLSILGTIEAPAGKITIEGDSKYSLSADAALTNKNALATVYLGPSASLLAQGTTILTPDPYGRRSGQVLAGGAMSLKGNIVAESEALLDVSGTSDELDFHPSRLDPNLKPSSGSVLVSLPWARQAKRVRIDSNGGTIQLVGKQMLFSDATLRGFAGGSTAIGGMLSISSGAFLIDSGAETNLIVSQSDIAIGPKNTGLGVGMPVLGADGNALTGKGYFAANRFLHGGFDSLDLGYEYVASATVPYGGNIEFQGPITIQAPGAIRLAGGGVITANNEVILKASYISIGQEFKPPLHPNDSFVPFKDNQGESFAVAPTSGDGSLSLNAQLVDVGTTVLKNISNLSITATNGDIRGSDLSMLLERSI